MVRQRRWCRVVKRLYLTQQLNPEFQGASFTPSVPPHVYLVTKVVGSVLPGVHEVLSCEQVDAHCRDEDWSVTIS